MKEQTKIYINEATAIGFRQIASMFETLKFYKKDKVYFTEKDLKKVSPYAFRMLLQIDEKKIDAHFDKILKKIKKVNMV